MDRWRCGRCTDVRSRWLDRRRERRRRNSRRTMTDGLELRNLSTLMQVPATHCHPQRHQRGNSDRLTLNHLTGPTPLQKRVLELIRALLVSDQSNCHQTMNYYRITDGSVGNVELNISHRSERAQLTHSVPRMADSRLTFRTAIPGGSVDGVPGLWFPCRFPSVVLLIRHPPSLRRVPADPVPRRPQYYEGATTPCTASLRLIGFASRYHTLPACSCPPKRSLRPADRGQGPGPCC